MNELILVIGGIGVGIVSVVLGGGLFWSMPLWQFLFPQIAFGALIGNVKVGSLFRGAASTLTTWKQINGERAVRLSLPLLLGSVIGAFSISKLDQRWSIAALLLAIVVVECSTWIASKIKQSHFIIACLFLGIYFGFFGAGGGVLIVALLRTRNPSDSDVSSLKAEARFIELLMSLVAVLAHFLSGNIVSQLWIPWSIGSLIGGYIGGQMLNHLGTKSGKTQKTILRVSYLLALFISIWSTTALSSN